ncbi:MAG: DUF5343 domain-containing protein [Chloroflexota bacterium]
MQPDAMLALPRERPPYATVEAFEGFLLRAADEAIPVRIDSLLLSRWKIAKGNESAMRTTLKALGLIDDDGRPTSDYRDLALSPSVRRAALRRGAKRAYPGIAEPGAAQLARDHLHDYFVGQRGLRGQMVDKAITFYRGLAKLISMGEAGESDLDRGRRTEASIDPAAPGVVTAARSLPSSGVTFALTISFPAEIGEDKLVEFLRQVRDAWRKAQEG